MAVINRYFGLAGMLLDSGADPNVPDPRGSVLHALAFMRRPGSGNPPLPAGIWTLDLDKALLARGANPNARIVWKEIPFDRDLAAIKLPPNIPVGRNFIGATPFYVAAKHSDVALMRLLLANGADPKILIGGLRPHKRLRIRLMRINEFLNGGFELRHTPVSPATELFVRQFGEPPLNQTHPRPIRGREVDVKPGAFGEPVAIERRLVGAVVVHDDVHVHG